MDVEATVPIGSPVLVPFDGSHNAEAVLPYVPLLAHNGRQVVLMQVIPEAQTIRSPLGEVMVSAEELHQASLAAANADLRRASETLSTLAPDLQIESIVVTGEPSEQIVEVARDKNVRSILLSSQGHSATRPGGFGSVVSRVVHTAPAPVIVARPEEACGESAAITRLVIAHDGSPRAELALPAARHLAQRLAAALHVVSVVEDEESELPPAVACNIDPQVLEEAQADALNAARRRVESIGASLLRQGLSASWEVRSGPAAASIIDACRPRDALVITSHGKSESRWMLGSTAEKLVRECPYTVILLRTPPAAPAESA